MAAKYANSELEIKNCFNCMKQLRTHLSEEQFISQVALQRKKGYQLAYLEAPSAIKAVVGFRILNNLAWGKFLYIDDFVTVEEARSNGYGTQLLSWIESVAVAHDCDAIHLDSGLEKVRAHEFYLKNGYEKKSMHFKRQLK